MDILNLVRETIRDIDEGQKTTSLLIQKCIRICGLTDDIFNLTFFKLSMRNHENKIETSNIREEFRTYYLNKGMKDEDIRKTYSLVLDLYIEVRTMYFGDETREENVLALSVTEIEDKIESISQSLDKNTIPDGLHPVDVYYSKKTKSEIDDILIDGIHQHKRILGKIRNNAYSYLIELEKKLLGNETLSTVEGAKIMNKNAFIIHGHNEAKWRELEKMLSEDFKLTPIVLGEQLDRGLSTLIDKFEYYAEQCSYAIALFTPDDLIDKNGTKYFQARPNVIYELGWFVARLGKRNVCLILQDNPDTIEMFSDFQGIIQKSFPRQTNLQ